MNEPVRETIARPTDILFQLSGRTAIITGAGTGLGRASARILGLAGANIVVAGLPAEANEDCVKELIGQGVAALAVRTDVRDRTSVESMIATTATQFGTVDILVNNAAIYPSKPWDQIPGEEWDEVLAVNLRAYFLCARAVHPFMKRAGWGRIINLSSITFSLGFPLLLHYVASKGGVVGFTRGLAREVGPDNITVNAIAPGAFPTAAEAIHADPEGYNQHVLDQQALKRRGRPEDIGHAMLFLASEAASFITGQTLTVDGGWSMQ